MKPIKATKLTTDVPFYNLGVNVVDGSTEYSIRTDSAAEALNFLNRFDHEGSTVTLFIEDGQETITLFNEEVYRTLENLILP